MDKTREQPARASRRRVIAGLAASALLALPGRARAQSATPVPSNVLTIAVGGTDNWHPGDPENTDVLMISRLDVHARTLRAVSISYDLWVAIPGHDHDKIARAYDFGQADANGAFAGGAALMKATIQENFGIAVDRVAVASFGGFVDIVNALGGVEVDNPYDVSDSAYPTQDYGTTAVHFPAGRQHLDGADALIFARTRNQDSDDGRVIRQHLLLRGLLAQAREPRRAKALPGLVAKHRKSVSTDLSRAEQAALALAAPAFADGGLTFTNVRAYLTPSTSDTGLWIYAGDWSQLPGYVQGVLDGSIQPPPELSQ